jgi:hypothetical protein
MVFEDILKAIRDCDAGRLTFNLGHNESFIFEGKWYPIRKIVNTGCNYANERADYNLYQSTMKLTKFLPVISANVVYTSCGPINVI